MESQTSQQLEEQAPNLGSTGWMIGFQLFPTSTVEAQKFRHVSELQLKLSQKLAATEASLVIGSASDLSLGLRYKDFEIEGWPPKAIKIYQA